MKKFIALLTTFLFSVNIYAADPFVEVSGFEGDMEILYKNGTVNQTKAPAIVLYINGEAVPDSGVVIENGTTLVPLRLITDYLQGDIAWDAETKTVVINYEDVYIKCVIGESCIYVNGSEVTTGAASKIIDSRTYVPLRAISEAFGTKVGYVGDLADDTAFIWVEKNTRVKVTKEDAQLIAEKRYFEDFLPSIQDIIYNIQGKRDITKENIAENFPSIGSVKCEVTHDLGHFWYVNIFENGYVGALVDKETGELYATHSFSLVNFSVAEPGDYSGWGWTFQ
ncbi:MAG: hypothetical protein IJS61_05680 [Firmicutes bacterium]|nr:hypothetical protein [Bacillota bacterium]